jgi:HlyD family secretion protein
VVALAVGIASGGAGVYVCGSQEPAPKDGQPASKQPATAPSSQPEGSKKAAGQPASAEARAKLRAQQLATRKARAVYEIARLTRELAELAVEEYEEATYPRDLAAAGAEIKLAKSDLTRAEDRLDWAERMFKKGYVSKATKASEEINHQKAMFSLEQAQSKKDVLVKYTREKTIKELDSDVKKAHSDELTKEAAWEQERFREIELERELRPKAD